MRLQHLGVDIEARIAELGDLLGQELHAVNRVAEDDGLVDLELRGGKGQGIRVREVGRRRGVRVRIWIFNFGSSISDLDLSTNVLL